MGDAAASEAGRRLAAARWGDTRVKALVRELAQRRAELAPAHLAELRALVGMKGRDDGGQ
jgi:hypothetical protein